MGPKREEKFGELFEALSRRGVTRRDFMKFCSTMAATLALPAAFGNKIAEALEKAQRPVVVWLEIQSCTGDTEGLLRASKPTVAELILDIVSLNYHETVMAPVGEQATKSLDDTVKDSKGKYIAIVEGSIPTGEGGAYCCIGGKAGVDIVKEVCGNAAAVIAVGTCATYGGWPKAQPNPTKAKGLQEILPNTAVLNLSGCPMNVENLTAVIVHYLTFNSLPQLDSVGRPLFAYGTRIHDNCERRAHYDAGQFVREWGDYGHRQGWCLYEMGCKGPETFHNCPTIRWNEGTNWPVGSGHGCVGCAEPNFWDVMSPFYRRLPNIPGFDVESTADKIGAGLAAVTAAGLAAHGVIRAARGKAKETEEPSSEKKEE
jgi:hydrogenase small subunit